MRFFWQRQKPLQSEQKGLPDFGQSMVVAGYAPANWMAATPEAYAKEGYMQNAIAFACINKISSSLASVDLDVAKYVGKEKQELEDHPLYELIERPNPEQGGAEFFKALASYYLIAGDAYVLKLPKGATKPVELWCLRPDRVKVVIDSKGQTTAFEYSTGQGTVVFPVDDKGRCDVLHLKSFNPQSDNYGLSQMAAAANSVDTLNNAVEWNKSLLQNGARPSGAFIVKAADGSASTLSDEQFSKLREQIISDNAGADNAGRPLILEGGLDWKEIGLSPKDMDFEHNMWAAARMIATVFGVPPMLVNIPGESTYSNMTEAKLSLWQETVLPLLDLFLDAFNNWLAPIYAADIFICYNTDNIPALEEGRVAKMERLQNVAYLSTNEKRRLVGFPDYAGGNGDMLFSDANLVPLDILGDGGVNG